MEIQSLIAQRQNYLCKTATMHFQLVYNILTQGKNIKQIPEFPSWADFQVQTFE